MNLTELHDWEIVGIQVNRESKALAIDLYFPEKKQTAILQCTGVQRFYASGMALQNVILDAIVFTSEEKSDYFTYCKKVLNLESELFEKNDNLKVIYVEPSVGSELACSCDDFELILNN